MAKSDETHKTKHEKMMDVTDGQSKSLDEINGTINVPANAGFWRTFAAYSGPGALIAVGDAPSSDGGKVGNRHGT